MIARLLILFLLLAGLEARQTAAATAATTATTATTIAATSATPAHVTGPSFLATAAAQLAQLPLENAARLTALEAALESKLTNLEAALETSMTALNQLTANVDSKASTDALNRLTSNMNTKASSTALNQLQLQLQLQLKLTKVDSKASTTALNQLTTKVDSKASSTALDAVKSKQALHSAHCGARGRWDNANQVVTYEKMLTDIAGGTNSRMNPATGTWTAGVTGTYIVTWAVLSAVDPGNTNSLYLRQNGLSVGESRLLAENTSDGWTRELGGRSLIRHLVRGDTLAMWADRMDDFVRSITFCVSLLHAD